jgi:glutathione S-transferase
VYGRWIDDEGFEAVKGQLFSHMPALARAIVPGVARRMVKKQVYAQGTGRHAPEDIFAMASEDTAALSEILGDKPFFLGESATSVDASAYAFLAIMLWSPFPAPIHEAVSKHANLVAYCERMKAKYYP